MTSPHAEKSIFAQVVGHQQTIGRLLQMVRMGRVPNSLLFVGPSGQGKKLVALGLAQAMVCEKSVSPNPATYRSNVEAKLSHAVTPCGESAPCLRVAKQQSESMILVAPEKGQIKIETARAIVQQLSLSTLGRARLVIVDDAHQLNAQAANALLKVIEEPPAQTYFILIAPSQDSVLKTLRSRSQVLRFRSLSRDELAQLQRSPVDIEQRAQAWQLWRSLWSLPDGEMVDLMREQVESREQGIEFAQLWFEFVRDQWFLLKGHGPLLHEDLREDFMKTAQLSDAHLASLSEKIRVVERDLAGHGDLQLTLENFIYQSRVL